MECYILFTPWLLKSFPETAEQRPSKIVFNLVSTQSKEK